MTRFAAAALVLSIVLTLSGLASSAAMPQKSRNRVAGRTSIPSTPLVKALLEEKGKQEELFTVKSFRRLNGIDQGPGYYTVEFEAVVKCLKSNTLVLAGDPGCNEGETVRYSSAVLLQKTEKGWRVHHWGSS